MSEGLLGSISAATGTLRNSLQFDSKFAKAKGC